MIRRGGNSLAKSMGNVAHGHEAIINLDQDAVQSRPINGEHARSSAEGDVEEAAQHLVNGTMQAVSAEMPTLPYGVLHACTGARLAPGLRVPYGCVGMSTEDGMLKAVRGPPKALTHLLTSMHCRPGLWLPRGLRSLPLLVERQILLIDVDKL